jgi:hypothetical protein
VAVGVDVSVAVIVGEAVEVGPGGPVNATVTSSVQMRALAAESGRKTIRALPEWAFGGATTGPVLRRR